MSTNVGCVTNKNFFQAQLMCEEGLEYNRLIYASHIKDDLARKKYLDRTFDNCLKRHLCYRNFLVIVNKGSPLGRNNRVVIPRCVVSRIREQYAEFLGNYVGFMTIED